MEDSTCDLEVARACIGVVRHLSSARRMHVRYMYFIRCSILNGYLYLSTGVCLGVNLRMDTKKTGVEVTCSKFLKHSTCNSQHNELGEGETFIRAPKIYEESVFHLVLIACLTSFEEVGAERKVSI